MNFKEIRDAWEIDSQVDITKLDEESAKQHNLHAKYLDWYLVERVFLVKLQEDMKQLYQGKYEFYTQGTSKEQHDDGWSLPAKGQILKAEVKQYIEADQDISTLVMKIEMQKAKVDYLKEVVSSLNFRTNQIRNIIEFLRFEAGG